MLIRLNVWKTDGEGKLLLINIKLFRRMSCVDPQQIIHELKNTLNSLEAIETKYYECIDQKHQLQFEIEQIQHRLVSSGKIDGRNEDIRKAQKWLYTADLQEKKRLLEKEEHQLSAKYQHLQRTLHTLQTIANIMIADKELSKKIMLTFK